MTGTATDFIELEALEKVFDVRRKSGFLRRERHQVRAVDGISFRVPRGEMVGYIGPNGAGKSTTIKMLTGILTPSSRPYPRRGPRPLPRADEARAAHRRGLRPANHPLVGPAAA